MKGVSEVSLDMNGMRYLLQRQTSEPRSTALTAKYFFALTAKYFSATDVTKGPENQVSEGKMSNNVANNF